MHAGPEQGTYFMKTTFATNGKSMLSLLAGLLCLALMVPTVFAQEAPQADQPAIQPSETNSSDAPNAAVDQANGPNQPDPPSRVARISFLDGTVSFQPGGNGDWGSAARNRPVTVGDKLWTDKDSRAELQAGQASIHMGSMTALSFLNLDEAIMQVRIAEGAINFRVRELHEGDVYEVDTPNLAFTVKEAGAFRVDVSENGDSTAISAIRGEGEVTAGGKTYTVHVGDRAEFDGVDNPAYKVTAMSPNPDNLDRWASDRDLREDNSTSSKYVSQDVPGRADLDDNGSWNEEPDYGPVWYPNSVAVGWAPYSYGYWNWVGPWGWTWIGYEPWGFAPYHYGRWGFIGSRWGWCPGPIFARPFYGPAFVGFLGGAHFGVGFGFGGGFGVGWFPLGFREPFFPGFHASRTFINNINIRNTTIRNVNVLNSGGRNFNYAFAHNTRAVTAASRGAFVGGQAIHRGAVHVTEASLRGAQVSNRTSFGPVGRQSSFGAANVNARSVPPSSVQNRSVMARTTPSAAAAHAPVRTANTNGFSAGRPTNDLARRTSQGSARQSQLSQGRPSVNGAANNRPMTTGRSWEAQGNSTDRGRAPQGFGSNNRPANTQTNGSNTQAMTHTDRPPWAGSSNGAASRSNSPSFNGNRPTYANGNRSYEPPSRSYSPPANRSYSSPRSSYPSTRAYSAPSRSYSAPTRTYSAPSHSSPAPHSSGGGGGAPHGGGSPHGGGGSHGGGGHH
jgi:uncharacterized membrane protein YgcG